MKEFRLKKNLLQIICEVAGSTWNLIESAYPGKKNKKVIPIRRDIWYLINEDMLDKAGGGRNERIQTEEES